MKKKLSREAFNEELIRIKKEHKEDRIGSLIELRNIKAYTMFYYRDENGDLIELEVDAPSTN
jgi:hypothetical protein